MNFGTPQDPFLQAMYQGNTTTNTPIPGSVPMYSLRQTDNNSVMSQMSGGPGSVGPSLNQMSAIGTVEFQAFNQAGVRPDNPTAGPCATMLYQALSQDENFWISHFDAVHPSSVLNDFPNHSVHIRKAFTYEEGFLQVDYYWRNTVKSWEDQVEVLQARIKTWKEVFNDPNGRLALACAIVEYKKFLCNDLTGSFDHCILVFAPAVKHYVSYDGTKKTLQERGPAGVADLFALTGPAIDELPKVSCCSLLSALDGAKFFEDASYQSLLDMLQHPCVRFLHGDYNKKKILYNKEFHLDILRLLCQTVSNLLPMDSTIGLLNPKKNNATPYSTMTATLGERIKNYDASKISGNVPIPALTVEEAAAQAASSSIPQAASRASTSTTNPQVNHASTGTTNPQGNQASPGIPMATEPKAADLLAAGEKDMWIAFVDDGFEKLFVSNIPAGGGTSLQQAKWLDDYKTLATNAANTLLANSQELKDRLFAKGIVHDDDRKASFPDLLLKFVIEDADARFENWKGMGSPRKPAAC